MEPSLIHGDTRWANAEVIDSLKEDFPFLRDSIIEPLPSPRDNWVCFFKAENHGVFALHESEFLYYLGKDIEEAEEGYKIIKAYGWDLSPFLMVEKDGTLDTGDCLRLWFCGHIFSKTFPDPDVTSLAAFQKEIIDVIEYGIVDGGWPTERLAKEAREAFTKLMEHASDVAFVEIRLTYVDKRFYLRWTDKNGGVGHLITGH